MVKARDPVAVANAAAGAAAMAKGGAREAVDAAEGATRAAVLAKS